MIDVTRFIKGISPIANKQLQEKVQFRLDDLTKPPGSLGRLEDICIQYCLCRNDPEAKISNMAMYTFAGDHGITDEKITPFPKEVTVQMVENMISGGAAISVLCKKAAITSTVIDIGTEGDIVLSENSEKKETGTRFIKKKIGRGTKSFLNSNAMSSTECEKALDTGYSLARDDKADLFGIGEMGIGNTASASAIFALLLNLDAHITTGSGTGSTGELLERKVDIIERALSFHRKEWDGDPIDALRRVGGYEIAGMTGFIFGAASGKKPVVIDGFISSAAAFVALKTAPSIQDYLIFSHASSEKFHKQFLRTAGITPLLDLGMRLGEGTGAVLAMQIIEQALNCYHSMASFSQAGVAKK